MPILTPLQQILASYRGAAVTEREKGTYFEELICVYLRNEPTYADLYSNVWMLSDVPAEFGISKADTGIDLVARTRGTGEFHAIQCKFYAEDYRIQKSDIDSFFTASGQKPFKHRIIVSTTNDWTDNAENSLFDQQPPVSRIDLHDLETSQIDWAKYKPKAAAKLKPKYAPRQHQQTAINAAINGLKADDRGKLIMACGTGKTYTSLKIAEVLAGSDKRSCSSSQALRCSRRHSRNGHSKARRLCTASPSVRMPKWARSDRKTTKTPSRRSPTNSATRRPPTQNA